MDAFKVRFLCARGRRTLMADIVSPEKRSQNMSAIRSKNTKPEVYLRKLLFAQGYRYRIADKSVPGHPDIFLRKYYLLQSGKEIAAALGMSVESINTRLSRGRDRLRRELTEKGVYSHA